MVARAQGRGGSLALNVTCPACSKAWEQALVVPDNLEPIGKKPEGYQGLDTVTLPICGDEVVTRPLNVGDELAIIERNKESRLRISDSQARRIASIVTVGGGKPDNNDEVNGWLNALDPADVKALNAHVNTSSPHLRQQIDVECEECKHVSTHTLRIESDFFRSGGFRLDRSSLVQKVQAGR